MASEGAGSRGTLHDGDRKTTVKDRKKEVGKGLLGKMLPDLGIERAATIDRALRRLGKRVTATVGDAA